MALFGFLNKSKPSQEQEKHSQAIEDSHKSSATTDAPDSAKKDNTDADNEKMQGGFFARLSQGLSRTRTSLSEGLDNLLLGAKAIDDNLFEEIETLLLTADIGVETTTDIMQQLTQVVSRQDLSDPQALYPQLSKILANYLQPCSVPLSIPKQSSPFVLLMVGTNGVGKTTTIGKLSQYFMNQKLSVMLAAGDTFRAAAIEQLQVWGTRNNVPVVAQSTGADSASVIYDAFQSAKAKNIDVLIADTAGRLQNKDHLMTELSKIVKVIKKLDAKAPHEIMLVVDASTGQNALSQAKLFNEAVGLTGITLTKLDGTAKGGIIFTLSQQQAIPIRFIGIGEQVDDLRPFDASSFIDALFNKSVST